VVNLPEIKPGITTQAEVRNRMGEPGFIHSNDDGTVTWEYSRQPAGVHCYMISFDRQEHRQPPGPGAQRRPATACCVPGMSKDEVRRRYGQPARKRVFVNLREEIWEWRIEGEMPTSTKPTSWCISTPVTGRSRKARASASSPKA
jgi:hypothetical protein